MFKRPSNCLWKVPRIPKGSPGVGEKHVFFNDWFFELLNCANYVRALFFDFLHVRSKAIYLSKLKTVNKDTRIALLFLNAQHKFTLWLFSFDIGSKINFWIVENNHFWFIILRDDAFLFWNPCQILHFRTFIFIIWNYFDAWNLFNDVFTNPSKSS